MPGTEIRPAKRGDLASIQALNRLAFGGEAESSLIAALEEGAYARVSLVAEEGGKVIGHILFSQITLVEGTMSHPVLSLAPMSVEPAKQRRGIGKALVREGLEYCRDLGFPAVFVLGHPDYYPSLGFSVSLASLFRSPYSGPAFMALELTPGFLQGRSGRIEYSQPFLALDV